MTRSRSRHALREAEGPWLLPEEGPWAGPPPLDAARWGAHPIRTVREVHVADRRIIVRALGETAAMWHALGCHTVHGAPYGEIDVVDPRIGIVLALVPLMSPEDIAHWGLEQHRRDRPCPGPAPIVFRIPKRIRGLGPWTFSQPIKAGYGAVTPIGARDALKACGWRWHAESQIWTASTLQGVAGFAAYAEAPITERLAREGLPIAVQRELRMGPALIPWKRNRWVLLCNRSEQSGFARPRAGQWRGVIAVGWETRDPESAHTVRRFAPRCLADLLVKSARTHALRHIHPTHVQILAPEGIQHTGTKGKAPMRRKPTLVWCKACEEPVSIVPIPGAQHLPCNRTHCASAARAPGTEHPPRPMRGLTLTELAKMRALATRTAWRKIAWILARADLESNQGRDIDETAIDRAIPHGLALRPGQRAGIRHGLEHAYSLNAATMAGGKTIMTLVITNHLLRSDGPHADGRILVVVPPKMRTKWLQEATRWLDADIPRMVVRDPTTQLPRRGVVIVSYNIFDDWPALEVWLRHGPLVKLVTDEGHRAKNHAAQRTRAITSLPVLGWLSLTGTPIMNRPRDVQPMLGAVSPEAFGNAARYAWAYHIEDMGDPTPTERAMCTELGDELRRWIMYRPAKETLLGDLPQPLEPEIITVQIENGAQIGARQETLFSEIHGADPRHKVVLLSQLSALRREAAEGKRHVLRKLLERLHAEGKSVHVWQFHRDIAELTLRIANEVGFRAEIIYGGMTDQTVESRRSRFNAGEIDLLSLTLSTGGEGLDMPRADTAIILEPDWTPQIIDQAIGRAQRPGRVGRLQIIYIIAEGTLDGRMVAVMVGKTDTTADALGDSSIDAQLAALDHRAQAVPALEPAP